MSEQNNESTPLTIEDYFRSVLIGEKLRNALDYVACKRAKGRPVGTPDGDMCNFDVGVIGTQNFDGIPGWWISIGHFDGFFLRRENQDFQIDDKLKELVWSNVRPCYHFKTNGKECGCGSQPGRRVRFFGKEFHNTCHGLVEVQNADGEVLELTKKLTDVWAQVEDDAAKIFNSYVPKENEWLSVRDIGAHTGRPLGRVYTKSLDVQFYLTSRRRFVLDADIAFSGGGWVPTTAQQIPAGLRIGGCSRFKAYKGPDEGWHAVETLKYQGNVTYFAEMSFNITDNTYSATVWMPDADGETDTPYLIAKDYPFRFGGDSAIPSIKAIDTVYVGSDFFDHSIIVRDFKVVGGE